MTLTDPVALCHLLKLPQELIDQITAHIAAGLVPDLETSSFPRNNNTRQTTLAQLKNYAYLHRRFLRPSQRYLFRVVEIRSRNALIKLGHVCRDDPSLARCIKYIAMPNDLLYELPLVTLLQSVDSANLHLLLGPRHRLNQTNGISNASDIYPELRGALSCVSSLTITGRSAPSDMLMFDNLECLFLDQAIFPPTEGDWTFPFHEKLVTLSISHSLRVPEEILTKGINIKTLKISGYSTVHQRWPYPPPESRLAVERLHISDFPSTEFKVFFHLYMDERSITHYIDENDSVANIGLQLKAREQFRCIQYAMSKCPNLRYIYLKSILRESSWSFYAHTHDVTVSYVDGNGTRVERILAPLHAD